VSEEELLEVEDALVLRAVLLVRVAIHTEYQRRPGEAKLLLLNGF
jgi:hypothetical protein